MFWSHHVWTVSSSFLPALSSSHSPSEQLNMTSSGGNGHEHIVAPKHTISIKGSFLAAYIVALPSPATRDSVLEEPLSRLAVYFECQWLFRAPSLPRILTTDWLFLCFILGSAPCRHLPPLLTNRSIQTFWNKTAYLVSVCLWNVPLKHKTLLLRFWDNLFAFFTPHHTTPDSKTTYVDKFIFEYI